MTGEMYGLCVVGFFLACLVVYSIYRHFHDKKAVKEGCCGRPWRSFDMDSSGEIGLTCDTCDKTIWVSSGLDLSMCTSDRPRVIATSNG